MPMRLSRRTQFWILNGSLAAFGLACQLGQTTVEEIRPSNAIPMATSASADRDSQSIPELPTIESPMPSELTGPVAPTSPGIDAAMWLHIPDPSVAAEVLDNRLRLTRFGQESIRSEYEDVYEKTKRLVAEISRPEKQFRLTLADALRRALLNNYQIKVDGYAPAISTAQIVQSEAAFDAAFFANINRNNTDRPTPSQLLASQTDTTQVAGGIRKLLATGATMTLTQAMIRVDNPGFQFQTINPSWTQNFTVELRQPVLKNFGIDFNRAQINIRKNERKINEELFRQRVIEVLNNTEQAYWQLVAARRDVVISAELLAQARKTYDMIDARKDFDAYKTLLYRSDANVKQQEFAYIDVKNRVRNAEDQLLNLMNDSSLPLSAEYEIIPVDGPTIQEIVRDRFATIETAIERRPEVVQARHSVDTARIGLGVAKNQALPQLDVVYRMTMNGLGANSDEAFDQMTGNNFSDHFVGIEFLWFFGERGERAGIRVASLQQSQAVLRYKQAIDSVITDCRVAMRNIETNFEQLDPSYQGVIAASENLRSLQERQENKSPPQLDTILNAQTQLAQSRRALLQSAVNYNIALVDVERAKGTLLEYNNIVISEAP
ncbi:MAG: TolC family protein [Phycisphaerae bacterium]|nr:TolC family protein [Phycisphaerae bacterium]